MKIKLISPARKSDWGSSFWDVETLVKVTGLKAAGAPLALLTLAALTPVDTDVVITDENLEPIDFEEEVDLVGISFFTSYAPRAYEIADIYRSKGVRVVLGGIHASMLPDEAIVHADSVVIGEAEETWPRLINDFKKGTLQKFYRAERFPSLKNSPIPRWDLLEANAYSYFTVQTGRGCPHGCDFCAVHAFNGRKYRYKSIDRVVKEIELLKSINPRKNILLADDNLLAKPSHAKELLKVLELLDITFTAQVSIDRLEDDEMLDMLCKAGCLTVFVGFESISQESLDTVNKSRVNNVTRYKKVVEKAHSVGIEVLGSFVLGFDADDNQIFEETANFIQDSGVAFAMINILTPLPGTRLYNQFVKERRILSDQWQNYDAEHVCMVPKNMSGEELLNGRTWLLKEISSYPALYKRLRNLSDKGVYSRAMPSTKERILIILKCLISADVKRFWFILKSFWRPKSVSIASALFAISVHDYAISLPFNGKLVSNRQRYN
ncbi:MAG: B12-binding domain-containing radical SAM protein [Actinobacteria bacterium]|nr:B12-binding domain-containing radical SAM protein [Actinomycetota bacterium]